MKKFTDEEILNAFSVARTFCAAASVLNIQYKTFARLAKKIGLKPNQGSKGISRPKEKKISTKDILEGKYPSFQTYKLKLRLIEENIKQNICEICNIDKWLDMTIQCELDHINGNPTDHRLENLRMLCPNCHSQTDTYRSKTRK